MDGKPKMYHTLVMEIRPRLQSVNIYIALKEHPSDVQINLNRKGFDIILNGIVHSIFCADLDIMSQSLSLLHIDETHISFRVQINCRKVELLRPLLDVENFSKNKRRFNKNAEYTISCANCSFVFCDNVIFERVLPLPTENLDINNWFCHDGVNNFAIDLNPSGTDLFYAQNYVHLDQHLLNNVLKSDKVIVCKRCLLWLGLKINKSTLKIWFNTAFIRSSGLLCKTSALEDVYETVGEILNASFSNTAKIILPCRVSNAAVNYILLWVVEKKLNILAQVATEMKSFHAAKVLFKFEDAETDTVVQWKKDTGTVLVEISKAMMVEFLKRLHRKNKLFPKQYSITNGFLVSYLSLYEDGFQ